MPKLKGSIEKFCCEYTVDYNGTHAAIRAGYKKESARQQASRLLSKEEVVERIAELQAQQVKRLGISSDYVVLQTLDTYHRCREATPVREFDPATGEWEETGYYQFDSKGALKALEMLGKHLGMFDKKIAVPSTGGSNLLERLTESTGVDLNTDDLPEVE